MSNVEETLPPIKSLEDIAAVTQESLAAAQVSLEGLVKVGQDQVHKHYSDAVAVSREQLDKVHAQLHKGYEDISAYSQGNVTALVVSSTILVKGFEDIAKTWLSLSKASLDKYMALSAASLKVTSVNQLAALSSDYAKSSYETLLTDTNLLQELAITVANQALAPLTARVNLTVEKFAKPLAA